MDEVTRPGTDLEQVFWGRSECEGRGNRRPAQICVVRSFNPSHSDERGQHGIDIFERRYVTVKDTVHEATRQTHAEKMTHFTDE